MGVTELVIAVLATWQIVEIWHHSAIMASWRAYVEVWDDAPPYGFIRSVLACPFCLSVWVGFATFLTVLTGPPLGHWLFTQPLLFQPLALLAWLSVTFVWGMAISRAANVGNDVLHRFCRTERTNKNLTIPAEPISPENQDSKNVYPKDPNDHTRDSA